MKQAVLDTNIYIKHWQEGAYYENFSQCRKKFIIRQSSVVLHELRRGAKTSSTVKLVETLKKVSSIIYTPTEKEWWKAGEIVQKLSKREGWEGNKIKEIQNDVLIALTAFHNGVTVITNNKTDFEKIQRAVKCTLEIW